MMQGLKTNLKMVIGITNLIICFLPLISTFLNVGSIVTMGRAYISEVGFSRQGTPLQTIEVKESIYCMMECNILKCCLSFNLISNGIGLNGFVCEFFDESAAFGLEVLLENEASTYYDLSFTAKDCLEIPRERCIEKFDGIYPLVLSNNQIITAACDMDTADGGWTLLQRRFDGSVDFYRDWESYKNGFGDLEGEFWLGLEKAYHLMKNTNTTLRFDLWDGNDHYYQEYYEAVIRNEAEKYRLSFNGTEGDAGDSMSSYSNDRDFTTKDRDNDERSYGNCAVRFHGAWWYASCHLVNLNGDFGNSDFGMGMNWKAITGLQKSLSRTEIKIKRSRTVNPI